MGFDRAHVQSEDFAVSVGVHPGRDQAGDVDHSPGFADFHGQCIGGDERVRPGVQRAGAERFNLGVEVFGHHADLRLRQPGDAELFDQLLHPPGRYAQQI
jgi:hypothetical protein